MEGLVFPLGKAILLIGRDKNSGIRLDHEVISENHASIVGVNGVYILRDKGSTNGTFVNGKKVTQKTLSHNDMIHFGPYQFQVDMESESSALTALGQPVSLVDGTGQEYQRSVRMQKGTGATAKKSIQVMMAGKIPTPVASAPSKSNPLAVCGLAAAMVVIFLLGYWLNNAEQDRLALEERAVRDRNTIEGLQKDVASSVPMFQSLESDLKKAKEQLRAYVEANKKTNEELVQLRKAVFTLNAQQAKAEEEARKPAKATPATEKPLGLDAALARVREGGPTPPITKLQPLLKFPAKIILNKETAIPLMADGKVVGSLKLPKDKGYAVKGAENENVIIDMEGTPTSVPKDNTNFEVELDAANVMIKQANELFQIEQDALKQKVTAERALADKLSAEKREKLMASKMSISLRVSDITKDGVIGTITSGPASGVRAILCGANEPNLVAGETWKGDAYQMGVLKLSESARFRQFTTSLAVFEAFKDQEARTLTQ